MGGPKREQGVLNCPKSIPRGYGMSSSTKAAVEAKRGLKICLIWIKNAKHEVEQSETCAMSPEAFQINAWRLRDILECENGGRRDSGARKLPNMGKNAKCELQQSRTQAEGLEMFQIDAWQSRKSFECENGLLNEAKGRNLVAVGQNLELAI